MNQDEFFAARGPRDPVVAGRYRLPDPETGGERSWTRASNYGYPIADQFGLTRWRHRQIMIGLSRRPDLLRLLSVLDPEDTAKIDEVIATALEVAGTTEAANLGTAIHEALALADRGQDYPDWARPYVEGYRVELARHGLEVVLVERQVINRPLGAAGRPDRVYRTADDRYVIGDLKPDTHLDLAAGEFACQVAVYATATHLQADDGTFYRLDAPIDQDEAVIVAVNRETGATSVYRLDLRLARYGANLAEQVRGWHRMTRGLLLPYVRPAADVAPQLARSLTALPSPSTPPDPDEAQANSVQHGRHLQAVPDPGTMAVSGGLVDPGVEGDVVLDPPAEPPTGTPPAHEPQDHADAAGPELLDEAALGKLNKAQLQQYGRERGQTDLAHTRKVLLEIYRRAGIVAGVEASDTIAPTEYARPGAPAPVQTGQSGPPAPTEDPDDPRTTAFRTVALARIRTAPTVGHLGRYHQSVVTQYGDQAWSDELTEAARVRVSELDAQGQLTGGYVPHVLDRILECNSQHDIAQLWEETTIGGSAPDRWPDEVQRAATERLEQIRAATPPPPSNPFA